MSILITEGATHRYLAEHFGLALSVVQRDIKEIERRWRVRAEEQIDLWKGRLLSGHERVKAEAWSEWHKSKIDAQKIVEVTELVAEQVTHDRDGMLATDESVRPKVMELTQRSVTTEGRTGDPRYLTVIINAQAEQAKILGVHAPAKLQHAGADGGPLAVQLIEIVPPETTDAAEVAS